MKCINDDILKINDPIEISIPKVGIEDNSIHQIITSPPYNVGINYDVHEDKMTYDDYIKWLTRVFVLLKPKMVDGGRVCINIAPTGIKNFAPIHHDLITQLRQNGYRFVTDIIWYKQNRTARTAWGSWCSPSCPYVLPSWEYVFVLQNGGSKLIGDKKPDITKEEFLKYIDGFWSIKPETAKKGHPVPFPEELVYRLIKLYTYPGNTVCDPFGGCGTVSKVAERLKRNSIYVDISEKYYKIAMRRAYGETIDCPWCGSKHTKKIGMQNQIQRYLCKDCKKTFSSSTREKIINTLFQIRNTNPENIKKILESNHNK